MYVMELILWLCLRSVIVCRQLIDSIETAVVLLLEQ